MRLRYRVVTIHGDQFFCKDVAVAEEAGAMVELCGYHATESDWHDTSAAPKDYVIPALAVRYIERGSFEHLGTIPRVPELSARTS